MVLWGQLHCLVFQCNTIPEETSFLDSLFADKQHDLLSKETTIPYGDRYYISLKHYKIQELLAIFTTQYAFLFNESINTEGLKYSHS